jgi:glycosyltransferase involved in cell wall biosynthesis
MMKITDEAAPLSGRTSARGSVLRVAMIGTRGVPANYGGFETAVEEIGRRLVERGHQVTVYCRLRSAVHQQYLGMDLVYLPAINQKVLETLSHTSLSVGHMVSHRRPDVAVVFNAANALLIPGIHARRIPVATNVDGLEWKRAKWDGLGRQYYRFAEQLAVRWSDALIADAPGIADYYRKEFDVGSDLIPYGAPIITDAANDLVVEMGLKPGCYHLAVARFEPENNVHLIVDGYRRSAAELPLVVVGSARYSNEYIGRVRSLAGGDSRIRFEGGVWEQDRLDQLYFHSLTYIHGHSVGGTNPSLLRAMGAGANVLAYDVVFNRDVLGERGLFFGDPKALASLLEQAEADPAASESQGAELSRRAASRYTWDDVTDRYEALCRRLADGFSQRGTANGARTGAASR